MIALRYVAPQGTYNYVAFKKVTRKLIFITERLVIKESRSYSAILIPQGKVKKKKMKKNLFVISLHIEM